jgi:hypothetical protein
VSDPKVEDKSGKDKKEEIKPEEPKELFFEENLDNVGFSRKIN